MPTVFVLARDWKLRTAVRAELRELGIHALGIDSPDDAGRILASGEIPAAMVIEAAADFISDPAIQALVSRVPSIWIASHTERIPLPLRSSTASSTGRPDAPSRPQRGVLLYRPVRIADIVSHVQAILQKGQAA
jgi:hypothetical protein